MRILIDARTIGDKPSGIGMYGYNFIRGIRRISPETEIYLVTDIAKSSQIKELMESCVETAVLGYKIKKNFGLIKYFKYVQQTIHKVQPDIFWEINNLFPVKLVNPYGKIVATVHDMFPCTLPDCFGKVYPYYFRYGMKNMLRYTDALVYNSEETKRDTERFFPNATGKTNVILYILIPELPPLTSHRIISEKPYYFYLGNLEKRKGTDILLEGYRKYCEKGGKKELYIGGKVREDDIQAQLDELLKDIKQAHYVGYLSGEEKEQYLAQADCFLFPSRAEGFGMPVLEAMEYDCPVLVSDLSIFHEIIGEVADEFELSQDVEEAAERMAVQMLQLDEGNIEEQRKSNHEAMQRVLARYREDELVPKMLTFFHSLIQ